MAQERSLIPTDRIEKAILIIRKKSCLIAILHRFIKFRLRISTGQSNAIWSVSRMTL